METNIKQVYSVLKIDDGKLQILTSEYFNTRFNIINVFETKIEGIIDYKITDKDKVIACIKDGIKNVSEKIGATVEKVILVLPPLCFNRIPLKVSIIPTDGFFRKTDIARAITNSLKTNVDENLMVINTSIAKYVINGIASRRFPEKEQCKEASVEIDLLCGDKSMTYSYVETVCEAGLEILDLTFDNYAIAKESVLLDNSINQNIILLDVENSVSYLSLLSKGKLVSTEIIYNGLNSFTDAVYEQYHINVESIERLVKYNVDYNSKHLNDPVFAWNSDNSSNSITVKELNEIVKKPLDEFVDKIVNICSPIIELGATIFVCGEGSSMNALIEELKLKSKTDVRAYYPDAIGVRNANVCGAYGALYVYKEKAEMNDISVNCVNMVEYENTVNQMEVNVEGESITSKIKNLFEIYKGKEGV